MILKGLLSKKSKKSKNNKTNIDNVNSFKLPIEDVKDNVVIGSSKNTYKTVMRVTPINGELSTFEQLEAIAEALEGALCSFQGRQAIYIMSERVDISRNIDNIEKRKMELTDEFKIELLDNQANYLKSRANKAKSVLNFYYAIEVNEKNKGLAETVLEDSYISIKRELESEDMFVERLSEREIKTIIYEKLNPEASLQEPLQDDWSLVNLYPENAVICKDGQHIELGNSVYRFLAINKYPKQVDYFRWLKKLYKIKGDINITITLEPKNKGTIIKDLSKAYDEAEGKELSSKDNAAKKRYNQEKESADRLIENIGSDNVALFDTSIMLSIGASNKEELNTLFNTVRSTIGASYLQATEIKRKEFEPIYNMLPILADTRINKNYIWNMTSSDVASIIPFDSSEFMESKGTVIGDNETSGGLVIVNYRNKIYNNCHMCIIADSGSGKTFFIKEDAMRNIPYTDFTIMFDVKGDLIFPFGKRYTFSATSGIVVNPFHIRNAKIDSENDKEQGKDDIGVFLSQKIMELIVFFRWMIPDMTPFDESLLEEDIRECYEKYCGLTFESKVLPKEYCTMENLSELMENKIKNPNSDMEKDRRTYLRSCIRPYAIGTYSKIFNGQTNWDFNEFTVFDISNIPEAVQRLLYDILLKDTWQFCKKDGTINPTLKNVYIDEVHEFADPNNPQTLMFASTKLVKQGRGFGVRLVTATQNLPDLLSIPRYGQAIIDNSYFKLFMRLGESDLPVAKKLYNFSPNEIKFISSNKKTGNKGRGIFIVGSQRVAIQTRASKEELEILDPKQYEEIYRVKSRFYN